MSHSLLITDVDNTLLDWQRLWFETFSAMINRVLAISGVDEETLLAECSVIHQKYGTSEYSHLLEELPCLASLYGDKVLDHLQPAVDDFREARREHLELYPTVLETLDALKARNVTIAAYTESKAFYTSYRFRKLGLDGRISFLYSPPDHALPVADVRSIRKYPPETYELKNTEHRYTPDGETKPNPDILLSIVRDLGFSPSQTVYLGDNVLKDVWMAQEADILDVHAKYGAAQHREEYDLLRKVTHWTPEMVERERHALKPGSVTPTYVLENQFAEILPLFEAGK
jgi:phosphoglycolate phosphatase-like HAD superfamily hydrolase